MFTMDLCALPLVVEQCAQHKIVAVLFTCVGC